MTNQVTQNPFINQQNGQLQLIHTSTLSNVNVFGFFPTTPTQSGSQLAISATRQNDSQLTASTSNAASFSIGQGRTLDKLISTACAKPSITTEFIRNLEDNNLSINNPYVLDRIITSFAEKKLDAHLAGLQIYMTHHSLLSDACSEVIVRHFRTWDDQRLLAFLTGNVIISSNQVIPLFLYSQCHKLAIHVINDLVGRGKYDLIRNLVFCTDNGGKRRIENPMIAIEFAPVLNYLMQIQNQDRKIKSLMNSTVSDTNFMPLHVLQRQADAAFSFKIKLDAFGSFRRAAEAGKTRELKFLILRTFENNPANGLNNFMLSLVTPILNDMIVLNETIPSDEDQNMEISENDLVSEHVDFVNEFFSLDIFEDASLLHNQSTFTTLLPTLLCLIDNNEMDIFDDILSFEDSSACTPLCNRKNFQEATPLFNKLMVKRLFSHVEKIFSERDKYGHTVLHYNLEAAIPLLVELIDHNQVGMVESWLYSKNSQGSTPFHQIDQIFQVGIPLFFKLIEKGLFRIFTNIFSSQNTIGYTPFNTNKLADFLLMTPIVMSLIEKGQFELVSSLLALEDQNGNTLAHAPTLFSNILTILNKLADVGQFDIIDRVLSKKNHNRLTPIASQSNFNMATPLLSKLCDLNQKLIVRKLLLLAENINNDCKNLFHLY